MPSPPDYDDIPNTGDLVPPTSDEIPIAVLANTLAIRAVRQDLRAAKKWFQRMIVVFASGSLTVAGSVVGVAMERGEERERARHIAAATASHDSRITKLEERQWR